LPSASPAYRGSPSRWAKRRRLARMRARHWRRSRSHSRHRARPHGELLTGLDVRLQAGAGVTRRLHRQIRQSEGRPGPASQIANRIGQLAADLATNQAMVDQLRGTSREEAAHDPDGIAAALALLPEIADELRDMPEPELRGYFESLVLLSRAPVPVRVGRPRGGVAALGRRSAGVKSPRTRLHFAGRTSESVVEPAVDWAAACSETDGVRSDS
jgi:hypothetical protein